MRLPDVFLCGALSIAGLVATGLKVAGVHRSGGGPACSFNQGAEPGGGPVPIPESRSTPPARMPHGAAPLLIQVADVPLPGRAVRFDYQTQDRESGRLYLSHMNDAHIEVFDTRSQQVVGRVAETPGVTGVWVVPELKKLYASVTGRHQVAVIETDRLTVRATPGPIGFPDGIAFAPESRRIFVSDESGGGELVIDGSTDQVVARIPLGGEAGNTKYDPGSGCILVAVQTLNQIVAIDPVSDAVVGRYAPVGADHPHGMYVDGPDRLLFVANQGNGTLQVIDLRAMQVTGTLKVGDDPDVLAFDPAWHRLYVATEAGGLWVYGVRDRSLVVQGVLDLPHAHSVSVDTATHLVYLPLQDLGGRPVLRIMAGLPSTGDSGP